MTSRRLSRGIPLVVLATLVVAAIAFGGCQGGSDAASRNGSNLNGRTLAAFGRNLPTIPGAEVVTPGTTKAGAWHRTTIVPLGPAATLAFFDRELPTTGWQPATAPSTTPGGQGATWRRSGLRLRVAVAPETGRPTSTTSTASASGTVVNLTLTRTS